MDTFGSDDSHAAFLSIPTNQSKFTRDLWSHKIPVVVFFLFPTSIFLTFKCVVASSIIKCYVVFILTKGMLRNSGESEILRVKTAKVLRKG